MKIDIINSSTGEDIEEFILTEEDVERPYCTWPAPGQQVRIIDDEGNAIRTHVNSTDEVEQVWVKKWQFCDNYEMDWDKIETPEDLLTVLKEEQFKWKINVAILPEDLTPVIEKYFFRNI